MTGQAHPTPSRHTRGVGEKLLPVIEEFGPTVQGEGPLIGTPVNFLRFGLCTYRCQWCDSMHAVLPAEVQKNAEYLPINTIVERMYHRSRDTGVYRWVLTGGDPCIHDLTRLVQDRRFRFCVETQGYTYRPWLQYCASISISPKPPSSGMPQAHPEWEERYLNVIAHCVKNTGTFCKVVVFDAEDLDFAEAIRSMTDRRVPLYLSVGTDVGSSTRDDLCEKWEWVFQQTRHRALLQDCPILPQGHVLLWGHRVGV